MEEVIKLCCRAPAVPRPKTKIKEICNLTLVALHFEVSDIHRIRTILSWLNDISERIIHRVFYQLPPFAIVFLEIRKVQCLAR